MYVRGNVNMKDKIWFSKNKQVAVTLDKVSAYQYYTGNPSQHHSPPSIVVCCEGKITCCGEDATELWEILKTRFSHRVI